MGALDSVSVEERQVSSFTSKDKEARLPSLPLVRPFSRAITPGSLANWLLIHTYSSFTLVTELLPILFSVGHENCHVLQRLVAHLCCKSPSRGLWVHN